MLVMLLHRHKWPFVVYLDGQACLCHRGVTELTSVSGMFDDTFLIL